jgi:hypothetical protein
MHPMMIMAMAREVERERRRDRRNVQLQSLALANLAPGFDGSPASSVFARWLRDGFGLRPRFS